MRRKGMMEEWWGSPPPFLQKEIIWTPRRDTWSTHRRETRLVVKFRNERNDKESQKSDVLVSRLTKQYKTSRQWSWARIVSQVHMVMCVGSDSIFLFFF